MSTTFLREHPTGYWRYCRRREWYSIATDCWKTVFSVHPQTQDRWTNGNGVDTAMVVSVTLYTRILLSTQYVQVHYNILLTGNWEYKTSPVKKYSCGMGEIWLHSQLVILVCTLSLLTTLRSSHLAVDVSNLAKLKRMQYGDTNNTLYISFVTWMWM